MAKSVLSVISNFAAPVAEEITIFRPSYNDIIHNELKTFQEFSKNDWKILMEFTMN